MPALTVCIRASVTAALLFGTACQTSQAPFDVVLSNGRVMDPESGLDAVRHVGIRDGRIGAISTAPLDGREIVDAEGLVVAPGFIDLHAHGQDSLSNRYQARDGVTTALDLEGGVFPVAGWYASREGSAVIHYGATVGHIPARVKLKHEIDVGHFSTNPNALARGFNIAAATYEAASPTEIDELLGLLGQGLTEGALGIGMGLAYTPGARREEVLAMFRVAAARRVPAFVHVRSAGEMEPGSSIEAVQEVIANAAATGASLHIVHITSSGGRQTPLALEIIEGARASGLDVTTEAYPYTAWSTYLESALFDDGWREQFGMDYGDLQWVETGERLTASTFTSYRQRGGLVIGHGIPEDVAAYAVGHPAVMIASDGLPFRTGGEHPRGAGTFARVLGHYVREKQALGLMDALRKMTIMPAQRLEAHVPAMRDKGRIRQGADADITVFDPDRVIDRATFQQSMRFSEGIVHVIVDGTFVVRDGESLPGVFPGRAITTRSPS